MKSSRGYGDTVAGEVKLALIRLLGFDVEELLRNSPCGCLIFQTKVKENEERQKKVSHDFKMV